MNIRTAASLQCLHTWLQRGGCPPEDCGGPGGYANLKEIMTNPKDPEHKQMKSWLRMMGRKKWDAGAFDKLISRWF
jgi:hypothetical protein